MQPCQYSCAVPKRRTSFSRGASGVSCVRNRSSFFFFKASFSSPALLISSGSRSEIKSYSQVLYPPFFFFLHLFSYLCPFPLFLWYALACAIERAAQHKKRRKKRLLKQTLRITHKNTHTCIHIHSARLCKKKKARKKKSGFLTSIFAYYRHTHTHLNRQAQQPRTRASRVSAPGWPLPKWRNTASA